MSQLNILFLDFDGVLHPLFPRTDRSHDENQHFVGCSRLADVLDKVCPDIKIVVSSTWRYGRTMEQLKELLGPRLGARVIGATPNFNLQVYSIREAEALAWIDQWTRNRPPMDIKWCALDDVPGIWRSLQKLCVTDDGFREQDAANLEATLLDMLKQPVLEDKTFVGA